MITDYDAVQGVLSVTKDHVSGIDENITKTGEDRRIVLCPRAVAVNERQLRLRERLIRAGLIDHTRRTLVCRPPIAAVWNAGAPRKLIALP